MKEYIYPQSPTYKNLLNLNEGFFVGIKSQKTNY